MSKVSAIRKKALDLVRSQNWEGAIREYLKLAELDQANPNVFNELGDIYLKTGNKNDAYDTFVKAIDSYARVSLYNNAVAVCKKVLRLIPSRIEVLTKLGSVRMQQGLTKEAEGYYTQYLDGVSKDAAVDADDLRKTAAAIAADMHGHPAVVEKVIDCLLMYKAKDEAGEILLDQYKRLTSGGDTEGAAAIRTRIEQLGLLEELALRTGSQPAVEGDVITENNIWTAEHSDGERIEMDVVSQAQVQANAGGESTSHTTTAVADYGDLELEDNVSALVTEPPETADVVSDTSSAMLPADLLSTPEPEEEADADSPDEGNVVVSAITDKESAGVSASVGDDDYRSHYDLGMAYLEMDLLTEAIREFQFAARSEHYQIKSLEMVGLCFLNQNQPALAIEQLSKGLSLVDETSTEALGIKYNLGLACEMAGDVDTARRHFEDVYVVDATFRDIARMIGKYVD